MLELLISSILVMTASLIGVFSVWKRAGKLIERNLAFLVSFSAGVFLVISYQLGLETFEHAGGLPQGFLWILLGAVSILIAFRFLPAFHHHHDNTIEKEPHSRLDVRRILFGDAIHNVGDGILLAASFAVSAPLGAITAVGIFFHEAVQEVSEFFVLRQAGFGVRKALFINFAISATILIGSLGGYFLLESFEALEAPLLGITAGSFLVVVFHDLIPHSVRHSSTRTLYLKHGLWFVFGFVVMLAVSLLTNLLTGH